MVRGTLIRSLTGKFRPALRRMVAALCVLALVAVNVGHTFQHAGVAATAVASQSVALPDNAPDAPDNSTAIDHCHGCTLIAVAVNAPDVVTALAVAIEPSLKVHEYQPAPLLTDTPPPKPTT